MPRDLSHRRNEERSLLLHRAIGQKLKQDPEGVLKVVWPQVERMAARPSSRPYADAWRELLSLPLPELLSELVDPGQRMRDLRQCTPFAGVLTPHERWDLYRAFREQEEEL